MATNPTLLAMPLAKNGQKNVIPETQATPGNGLMSQSTGFPAETALPLGAGGVAPSREDFNGALNLISGISFYCQKGWTYEYDATQDYYKGCVVMDTTDGKRYECIADMTAGTIAPSSDTGNTYWKLYEFAPINSPAFTGTPTAPTAAAGTNTTQIATTSFVKKAVDSAAGANKNLSNLTTTGEDHFLTNDFTYIYPNGGTAANPASITSNTRYVETNPFPGYIVGVLLELKYNDKWGATGDFTSYAAGGSTPARGAFASFYDGSIIVQTGRNGLTDASNFSGNPFNISTTITSAPCRVKVWKVGKV